MAISTSKEDLEYFLQRISKDNIQMKGTTTIKKDKCDSSKLREEDDIDTELKFHIDCSEDNSLDLDNTLWGEKWGIISFFPEPKATKYVFGHTKVTDSLFEVRPLLTSSKLMDHPVYLFRFRHSKQEVFMLKWVRYFDCVWRKRWRTNVTWFEDEFLKHVKIGGGEIWVSSLMKNPYSRYGPSARYGIFKGLPQTRKHEILLYKDGYKKNTWTTFFKPYDRRKALYDPREIEDHVHKHHSGKIIPLTTLRPSETFEMSVMMFFDPKVNHWQYKLREFPEKSVPVTTEMGQNTTITKLATSQSSMPLILRIDPNLDRNEVYEFYKINEGLYGVRPLSWSIAPIRMAGKGDREFFLLTHELFFNWTVLEWHYRTKSRLHIFTTLATTQSTGATSDEVGLWHTTPRLMEGPLVDLKLLLEMISNITEDYDSNLTGGVAYLLKERFRASSCPTTTEESPRSYKGYIPKGTIISKCFVCGLTTRGIPVDPSCGDAFASDTMAIFSGGRENTNINAFRKYCRWDRRAKEYYIKKKDPNSLWGRWTGGCSWRWIDISGIYTQRSCRNRNKPMKGKHYLSRAMTALEKALKNKEEGCVTSPAAALTPLSRSVSLFARYHACVCRRDWCNGAGIADHFSYLYTLFIYSLGKHLFTI